MHCGEVKLICWHHLGRMHQSETCGIRTPRGDPIGLAAKVLCEEGAEQALGLSVDAGCFQMEATSIFKRTPSCIAASLAERSKAVAGSNPIAVTLCKKHVPLLKFGEPV